MSQPELDAYFKRLTDQAEVEEEAAEPLLTGGALAHAARIMSDTAFDRLLDYLDDPGHRARQLTLLDRTGNIPKYDVEGPHIFSFSLESDLHKVAFHNFWERISMLRAGRDIATAFLTKSSIAYLPEGSQPLRLTPEFQEILQTDDVKLQGKLILAADSGDLHSVHLEATSTA